MRILALVLVLSAIALPCSARTLLKSEPLMLAPYEVVFVAGFLVSGRHGAQGDRRDQGAAPEEGVRRVVRRAGFACGGHALVERI